MIKSEGGKDMSTQGWICIILLLMTIAISATPAYKNYRYWLLRKWGYFNVAIPILIMLVVNIVIYKDIVLIFILIPLDIIAIVAAIFTYFQVRKIKKY